MLIVAICSALLAPSGRRRLVFGGIAMFLFLWLFLSFQRNYWATTALALGLLAFLLPWPARLRALRWVVLGLVIVALLLWMPASPLAPWGQAAMERILSFQGETLERDTSALLRQVELQFAFRKIAKNPLFGVGIGNSYRPWMRRFDFLPWATTNWGLVWYCHNAYVWIWVKMGTPAVVCFLWLCFAFLFRGLQRWQQISDGKWRAVVLGFTLAFAGQMVSNLVAPNFVSNWVLVVFPVMMGINELIYRWNDMDRVQV
jgi:O-antigen ligase